MNLNYEKIKKLDIKKWLLGGNSKIYAIILIVFLAAVVFMLSIIKSIGEETPQDNSGTNPEENTTEVQPETQTVNEIYHYRLSINKANNFVDVQLMNSDNEFVKTEKSFRCSVSPDIDTGKLQIVSKSTWVRFDYGVHGHYTVKLSNGIYIHSVPYFTNNIYNLNIQAYNNLGNPAQVGYIYLSAADARWIFENCGVDTQVQIYENADQNPAVVIGEFEPITNGVRVDPTDIEAVNNPTQTVPNETAGVNGAESSDGNSNNNNLNNSNQSSDSGKTEVNESGTSNVGNENGNTETSGSGNQQQTNTDNVNSQPTVIPSETPVETQKPTVSGTQD